ncbi:hypothetical protein EVAR_57050_1 [Eumeta japonica]|uniref:Uncharacterized protein n=1 Tax=Eumeta variegata TaxID=151549 RepID=A0A4C1YTM6_EUMVA|nr:hypothetical protein EVAR_57050_1 [Eumeta japonica]
MLATRADSHRPPWTLATAEESPMRCRIFGKERDTPARAVATSSVQYSNARGREKERHAKVESRREKESIVNRGDSFRRRRSRSGSLAASPAPPEPERRPVCHRVAMVGAPGVGKTALISQFQTSECINAYDRQRGNCCDSLGVHVEFVECPKQTRFNKRLVKEIEIVSKAKVK